MKRMEETLEIYTIYTISAHQYLSQVTLYILHTLNSLYLNITFCYLRSLYIHMLDPYINIFFINI